MNIGCLGVFYNNIIYKKQHRVIFNFLNFKDVKKKGTRIMGIRRSVKNTIVNSVNLSSEFSSVINVRRDIYKTKTEIVKTPMVQEIVEATFVGGFLPRTIWANSQGVFTCTYDQASRTYHPNGVHVYSPEVTFDYLFAAALVSIFMDLYPNAYEMNRVTTTELSQGLQDGTWNASLELKEEYKEKQLSPAFDIFNIADTPVESLPLVLSDSYTESKGKMGKISLILGIISVPLNLLGGLTTLLGILCSLAGGITGLISIFATEKGKKKDKKAIWGLILSIVSWFLPLIIGILSIFSFLGIGF